MADSFITTALAALNTALDGLAFKERMDHAIPPELVDQLPAVIFWLDTDLRIGQRAGEQDHWELKVHIVVICHPKASGNDARGNLVYAVQNALETLAVAGAEIELTDHWDFWDYPETDPGKHGATTSVMIRRWVDTANHPVD